MSKCFKSRERRTECMFLPKEVLADRLRKILAEDLGEGDLTTTLTITEGSTSEAALIAKESGVAAGLEEATILLENLGLEIQPMAHDGERVKYGQRIMRISGDTRTILSAERTVLNLVSRMSGIATITAKLVHKIHKAKLKTIIACTRKTAPGLLYFDKKAVSIGGGDTHRLHLDDMALIKDNHAKASGSVEEALTKVRKAISVSKKIEVEVSNIRDVIPVAKAGADIVMLDNFPPPLIRKAIAELQKADLADKVLLEASGGITPENVLDYASTGIDIVSLGAITQSSAAIDVSLELLDE